MTRPLSFDSYSTYTKAEDKAIHTLIMDLLSSLGLDNVLPEQSTRLTSHPGILKALDSGGEDVRLGFNACLHCGNKLLDDKDATSSKKSASKKSTTAKSVSCKGCKRVKYCSTSCRKADSEDDPSQQEDGDEPPACGHSPVICALLNLCNEDDDAEEELENKSNNNNDKSTADQKKEAAKY